MDMFATISSTLASCEKFYNLHEVNLRLNSPFRILNEHGKIGECL